MTDLDKAQTILAASNDGQDLPIHQQYIVMAAQTGELGTNTAMRMVFDDLYNQHREGTEMEMPEYNQ